MASRVEREIESYRRTLARDPGNDAAFSKVFQQLVLTERWEELHQLFQDTPTVATVGRFAGAVADAMRVARDGGERAALRIVELWADALPQCPEVDWVGHLTGLERLLERCRDPEVRSRLLTEAATVQETRLGDPQPALRRYHEAFQLWPRNTRALHAARAVYAETGQWPMVLKLLQVELKQATERRGQARVLRQVAGVYAQHLGNPAQAQALLDNAATLDPTVPAEPEPLLGAPVIERD